MKIHIQIVLNTCLIVFLIAGITRSQPFILKNSRTNNSPDFITQTNINLIFINPGIDPFSGYRWRDVAGNLYSDSFRSSYGYDDMEVQVQITFEENDVSFNGELTATSLKPNFAYQIKLNGTPGTPSNELIGLAGRWWQEEWDGSQWINGQNLNNKGDGTSPNPNDVLYFARRDIEDATSPTGLGYRFTGYLVFDYFITDENGDAVLDFEVKNSYHVLWNTIQRSRTVNDGPEKSRTFDPDPAQSSYDTDYPDTTMTIFGEWERLPVDEVFLAPGDYNCEIILTEESFHGWPGGSYTGQWAAAMGATIQFTIAADPGLSVQLSSFTAESANSSVCLRWVTESELNHAGFEILRSFDRKNGYKVISDYRTNPELMGSGNRSVKHEYLYIDRDVSFGQAYWYYLVDVALNGQRTYHGPARVSVFNYQELNLSSSDIPDLVLLYPNFPNPFNSSTRIRIGIPENLQAGKIISLLIYNSRGQKVKTLYQGEISPGTYEIGWDGRSDGGAPVSSGIYYTVLNGFSKMKSMRMMLVK